MAEVDAGTWIPMVTTIATAFAVYFSLRRELKSDLGDFRTDVRREFARVDERFTRLEDRVATLDDRVYALAVGMRPVIDQAAARAPKA